VSRSKRRVARRRNRTLANRPPRYVGNMFIPPELDVPLPPDDAISYLTTPEAFEHVALEGLRTAPPGSRAVLTCDVIGGVHDLRCYDADRGLSLFDIASIEREAWRTYPLPLALFYIERRTHLPDDAEAYWDELVRMHREPPFIVDLLIASPEDHLVWSCATRFGPDPWSPDMADPAASTRRRPRSA
jgi:hypothetical protein